VCTAVTGRPVKHTASRPAEQVWHKVDMVAVPHLDGGGTPTWGEES
jgi:hypothetical protein